MKTIGLLGGITCESSLVYYKLINGMGKPGTVLAIMQLTR